MKNKLNPAKSLKVMENKENGKRRVGKNKKNLGERSAGPTELMKITERKN